MMLLFLDFDGVLRKRQSPLYRLESVLVDRLVELLRQYPEVEVVITSSWTDAYPLKHIQDLFSPDITSRIVGKTVRGSSNDDHARYREVLVYLRSVPGSVPWVALDDDPLHYPKHAPVVLVNPEKGVDVGCVESLSLHFEKARTARGLNNTE
jgi:hypothetical protein